MSAIYSESLSHSVFSCPRPLLYLGQFIMWPVSQSALRRRVFISAWQPRDTWTLVCPGPSRPWLSLHCCWCPGRVMCGGGGGVVNGERIWWAGKDIHSTKELRVSILGGCKSPHIQQQLFLAVLDGFLAGPAGPAGPSRTWQWFDSMGEWTGSLSESHRMTNTGRIRAVEKENLELIN